MSYKRAMWTSGYTYHVRCPNCGTEFNYTDRDLGYRAWFPNGFVYCQGCSKPIRHTEFYAVNPDGTPVFKTPAEADQSVYTGFMRAMGQSPIPPGGAAPCCSQCGRAYRPGIDHFCSSCGNKLD